MVLCKLLFSALQAGAHRKFSFGGVVVQHPAAGLQIIDIRRVQQLDAAARQLQHHLPASAPLYPLNGAFTSIEVGQSQLGVDDVDVLVGIHLAGDVDDVLVLEAAYNVTNGFGLTDVGQELVAQTFSFGGTFDQTGDVDELHRCRYHALRLDDLGQRVEAGDEIVELESSKAVEPLVSPVAGTVRYVNREAADDPSIINGDLYGEGWILKIALDDDEPDLLSAEQYAAMLRRL